MGIESSDDPRGWIAAAAREVGFDAVGFAAPSVPGRDRDRLRAFVGGGSHGGMAWMADTLARREDPLALWPEARSVIALGLNYGPAENPLSRRGRAEMANISVHARNRDYHDLLKKRLIVARADVSVKVFVDTAPVLERALAARAGVGWQGRHTNLVSRAFGSWLLLGEIFTTLPIPPDAPHASHCGTCRACLDVCPTNAFPRPYELDARRCVAYLTIEHRGHIPREFRVAIGNRVYGCDDCLAVCPWNRFARATRAAALAPRPGLAAPRLADFLGLDDAGFRALFSGSPVKRIGRARFLRNALIALGNGGDAGHVPAAQTMLADESPLVRAAAVWALSRLMPPPDFARLRARHAAAETDPDVRGEWTA